MEEKTSTSLSNGQQQFNLRWNNHTNNILQIFTEQFASEGLVDVTLACEGYYIKAHKMILSACSPYFQDLFRVHTVAHPLVIMNGMRYVDVKQVIDFMYRGEVKVLEVDLDSLLAVAESLQVKGLCSVRNNYKKEKTDTEKTVTTEQQSAADAEQIIPKSRLTKKRKYSNPEEISSDDESLSSTIKIEPPEIKDIDQEDEPMKIHEDITEQTTSKPTKTSKSGRIIRRKNYAPPEQSSKKTPPTITSAGFVDPAHKSCKIPRPPNAFMIFANEWRRKLASEYPKESNKEISIRLGIMWKSLSSDKKENYYSASRKADEEHKRKYPGYYYSPKEARLRKNMKESIAVKTKKHYDAMRLVKLVMKDNTTTAWSTSNDDKDDDSYEEDSVSEDVTVNVETDTDAGNLKIVSSPEEPEELSPGSKE